MAGLLATPVAVLLALTAVLLAARAALSLLLVRRGVCRSALMALRRGGIAVLEAHVAEERRLREGLLDLAERSARVEALISLRGERLRLARVPAEVSPERAVEFAAAVADLEHEVALGNGGGDWIDAEVGAAAPAPSAAAEHESGKPC